MLAEKNKAIQEASEHLHVLTEDEKIRLQCEGREMYERDMATIRSEGLDEGIALGISQGITEGQRINRLHKQLLGDNRLDDLTRSLDDPAYQEQLMQEYGIL